MKALVLLAAALVFVGGPSTAEPPSEIDWRYLPDGVEVYIAPHSIIRDAGDAVRWTEFVFRFPNARTVSATSAASGDPLGDDFVVLIECRDGDEIFYPALPIGNTCKDWPELRTTMIALLAFGYSDLSLARDLHHSTGTLSIDDLQAADYDISAAAVRAWAEAAAALNPSNEEY